MSLRRFQDLTLATTLLLAGQRLEAQPPNTETPKFELATVKANNTGEPGVSGGFQPGGRYRVVNYTLRALIAAAFVRPQINPDFLIAGGPKWMDSDHFDVDAKAAAEFPAGPDGPQSARRQMLQALLADRFRLKTHRETRQGPVYAVGFARADRSLGMHLRPSTAECPAPGPAPSQTCFARIGPGSVALGGATLQQLFNLLPRFVDRQVVDATGLTGRFDLELTWTPAPGEWLAPGNAPAPSDGPSLVTALQEQLGLKLQPQTGPLDYLVIDAAERPSGN